MSVLLGYFTCYLIIPLPVNKVFNGPNFSGLDTYDFSPADRIPSVAAASINAFFKLPLLSLHPTCLLFQYPSSLSFFFFISVVE